MKKYWQSIEEYKDILKSESHPEPDPKREPLPEFSVEGLSEEEKSGNHSRRDFLKMLGFTVGYAALANSCEMPVRKAIPYLHQPEEIVPGIANYYASTFFDGHDYNSILVKTREGRPIKIEGNELSSITRGGTQARVQASVLSLYDIARLQSPLKDNSTSSWEVIDREVPAQLEKLAAEGKKIVLLSTTVISPSTRSVINEFIEKYPTTAWVVYDTASASAMLTANEANFGVKAIPSYRFDNADLIVGFNADFQGNWLSPVEFTKQYVKGRDLLHGQETMSKHIQYESYLSLTGSNADYRVSIKPSEEGIILLNLHNEIAKSSGAATYKVAASPVEIKSLAKELLKNKGKSLVVSGTNDPGIQTTVNAINYLLGNYGQTIDLNTPSFLRQGTDNEMEKLVDEMHKGQVGALLFYNVNPLYDYPDADKFLAGMKKTELTVSFSDRLDETASKVGYVCPDNHYLESWNDAEPKKNYFSMVQPAIQKIFDTRQVQGTLLTWTGSDPDFLEYMQRYWETNIFPMQESTVSFIKFWNKSVHDGVFEIPAGPVEQPEFKTVGLKAASNGSSGKLELVLYEKIAIGTGKHANNPWLQELPDTITTATWDNYVCVPPKYAEEHELQDEDVVSINGSVELPVLIQPGQASGTIAIAVGYGRTSAGKVGDGIGKNVFHLMDKKNGLRKFGGTFVRLEKTEKTYPLARTQVHHTMEHRAIVRETTLTEFLKNPKSGNEMHANVAKQNLTLYSIPEFDGYHWGMAVNLNACIGCANCVISCQAENNVAVIGKEEVKNRRIMHWMRIDRYYSEDADNPEVTRIPVMCQHCDNAPCENVCPVAATPHSNEGLNQMAYNRCIGTRYCMNNCPYKVRRFNWYEYTDNPEFPYNFDNEQEKLVLNPDVTVRSRGVVEKCSLCVQRIQEKKLEAKREGRPLREGEIKMACQQSCPGNAIIFGDMNDPDSEISKVLENPRTYQLLEQIHTLPSVNYITKIRNKDPNEKHRNYEGYMGYYSDYYKDGDEVHE